MTTQEKHRAFIVEIVRIEDANRKKLQFPISYYFEWRIYPYNLVYDTTKTLDHEIKELVFAAYKAIFG